MLSPGPFEKYRTLPVEVPLAGLRRVVPADLDTVRRKPPKDPRLARSIFLLDAGDSDRNCCGPICIDATTSEDETVLELHLVAGCRISLEKGNHQVPLAGTIDDVLPCHLRHLFISCLDPGPRQPSSVKLHLT